MAKTQENDQKKTAADLPPLGDITATPFDLGVALQFISIRVYESLVAAMSEDENVDALHIQIP